MSRLPVKIKRLFASRLAIMIVPPLIWLVWMAVTFPGLNTPDALDQAQVARHVARGDGFVTSAIQPLSLALVPKLEQHPSLMHPPAFVLLEAVLFRLSGARPRLAALASGIGWILAVWLLFSLSTRLFDRRVALFATGIFLVNLTCLRLSVSCLPPMLTGALLVGLLLALAIKDPAAGESPEATKRLPWRPVVLSAVFAGLVILSDYSLTWAASLPLLIFWLRWPRSARAAGRRVLAGRSPLVRRFGAGLPLAAGFAGALLLTLLPWMVRNQRATGHPLVTLSRYELLTQTRAYPGSSVYRHYDPLMQQPWEFVNRHPLQVVRKAIVGVGTLNQVAGAIAGLVILALFVLGCLRSPEGIAGRIQRYLLAMILLAAIEISFTSQRFEQLAAFLPAMAVFAAAALPRLLGMVAAAPDELTGAPWWMRRRAAPLWAAWVLASLPLLADRANPAPTAPMTPSANVQFLASKTPAGSAIMTDVPALVAWYADKPAVMLAQDTDEMTQLERKAGPVPWVYFSKYQAIPGSEAAPWWLAAVRDPLGDRTFSPYPSLVDGEAILSHNAGVPVAREGAGAGGATP